MTLAHRWSAVPLFMVIALALLSAALVLEPRAWLGILVLPVLIGGALLVRGAVRDSKPAMYTMIFVAIFMIDATFRSRDFADKGVDFQVVLKIGIWCIIALIAMTHTPRWAGQLLRPTNIPVLMFLAWLLFTTTVSPLPAYTAACAFSVCAYIVFCAYIFASFDRVEIFAVMVVAITLFCIVSIAVYFAVPEFGRFVYWLNEQRYVSPRMAGIAGSANGMGRLAAFGLTLIILYMREFHRIHSWIVPISAPILAVSLVLTNSRTSMGMVAALWAAVYLLRWRRLYLAVFGLSLAAFAALVIIQAGDAGLKVLSRGGDVSEVTSLTGRSTIWHAIPALVETRPWTGYGYASSIVVLPEHQREVGFSTSQSHNLALQLLLTTGWVGLGLFSLSIFGTVLRLAYTGDRTASVMLAYVILNGLTESSAFSTVANICTVAFAIAITLPQEQPYYENGYSH
jgi:O-antigen ligase